MDFKRIYDEIMEIKQLLLSSFASSKSRYRSEQINELATALAKAQGEMPAAVKSSTNPFFKSKYADFEDLVVASRPSLSKYGLSVTQKEIMDDKYGLMLESTLMHSSGQWTLSIMPINPTKEDPQSMGSYISYLKRYTYGPLVGIVARGEDDDGAAATQQQEKKSDPKIISKNYERVTSEQVQNIMFEIGEHTEVAENMMKNFGVQKLSELPKEYYLKIIQKIRENVQSRKK